jgi:hypothetical protein
VVSKAASLDGAVENIVKKCASARIQFTILRHFGWWSRVNGECKVDPTPHPHPFAGRVGNASLPTRSLYLQVDSGIAPQAPLSKTV